MMATRDGAGGHIKPSSSVPVKWTLVEAEPEKPEGRRSKQREGYGRARAHGSGGSGSTSNWRNGREGGRGRGGQAFSGGYRGGRRGGGGRGGGRSSSRHNSGHGRSRGYGAGRGYMGATYYPTPYFNEPSFEEQRAYMTNLAVEQIEFYFTVENLCRDIFMRSYMDEEVILISLVFSITSGAYLILILVPSSASGLRLTPSKPVAYVPGVLYHPGVSIDCYTLSEYPMMTLCQGCSRSIALSDRLLHTVVAAILVCFPTFMTPTMSCVYLMNDTRRIFRTVPASPGIFFG